MRFIISCILFFNILIIACNQASPEGSKGIFKKNSIVENPNLIPQSVIIYIQPYNDISEKLVNELFADLKKVYPKIELKKAIALPKQAYYEPRNRFKADSLLTYLLINAEKENVVIGITSKDISTTKGNIDDWGVMGLGFCPGNACVVSAFRLNKSNVSEQLFKVAIHELGHTQGLEHCSDKKCFMRDAEGKNPTDEEKYFCQKCKAVLVNKGWIFNN
jgi:archaemetzincin